MGLVVGFGPAPPLPWFHEHAPLRVYQSVGREHSLPPYHFYVPAASASACAHRGVACSISALRSSGLAVGV
eukprot:10980494-Lingulodinium_polyedra.AAC.1